MKERKKGKEKEGKADIQAWKRNISNYATTFDSLCINFAMKQ